MRRERVRKVGAAALEECMLKDEVVEVKYPAEVGQGGEGRVCM